MIIMERGAWERLDASFMDAWGDRYPVARWSTSRPEVALITDEGHGCAMILATKIGKSLVTAHHESGFKARIWVKVVRRRRVKL